jgi:hypothetical protein
MTRRMPGIEMSNMLCHDVKLLGARRGITKVCRGRYWVLPDLLQTRNQLINAIMVSSFEHVAYEF